MRLESAWGNYCPATNTLGSPHPYYSVHIFPSIVLPCIHLHMILLSLSFLHPSFLSTTLYTQRPRKADFLSTRSTREGYLQAMVRARTNIRKSQSSRTYSAVSRSLAFLLALSHFLALSTDQAIGMFGLPIDKVATDRTGSSSGAATPVSSSSRSGSLQPPSSPTSTDTIFLDNEPNPTAVLLEALSKTDRATAPPSPKTQRQIALRPSEPRVPPIVRKAIELLDQKAVMTEGLFRISGSKARIYEVRGTAIVLHDKNACSCYCNYEVLCFFGRRESGCGVLCHALQFQRRRKNLL